MRAVSACVGIAREDADLRSHHLFIKAFPPERASRAAEVIDALDRQFARQTGTLTLAVVGVHAQGGDLWIQLCNSDATEAVVLRLRPDATATDAVSTLVARARAGDGFPRVLEVTHRG